MTDVLNFYLIRSYEAICIQWVKVQQLPLRGSLLAGFWSQSASSPEIPSSHCTSFGSLKVNPKQSSQHACKQAQVLIIATSLTKPPTPRQHVLLHLYCSKFHLNPPPPLFGQLYRSKFHLNDTSPSLLGHQTPPPHTHTHFWVNSKCPNST